MSALVRWFYLIALIVWLGEVVFFSFVVAPNLFRTFAAPEAGRAVGAIFPTYYRIGYVCGIVLLLTAALLRRGAAAPGAWSASAALAAVMLGATLYAGAVVLPRAAALRPQLFDASAPPTVRQEFDRLHRLAVTLNGAVLLCGLAVSVATAVALQPFNR